MKNIIQIVILISTFALFNLKSKAQSNLSFENWYSAGTYSDPISWTTLNFYQVLGEPLSALKSNKSTNGNFSVMLTSFTTAMNDSIPGGIYQFDRCKNFRPLSFSLDYLYNGNNNDSSFISVYFFKGNLKIDSLIGKSIYIFNKSTNWNTIRQNINWVSNDKPDSFLISITNSTNSMRDTLFIDNIQFYTYSTQIINFQNWDYFQSNFKNIEVESVKLFTVDGKELNKLDFDNFIPNNEIIIYEITLKTHEKYIGKIFNLE